MAFDKLLADLQGMADGQAAATLAKSQTAEGADDANIQAAGATGGDSGNGGEGAAAAAAAEAGAGAGGEGGEEGAGELAKSFEVALENGEKFIAMDATDLVKSLTARIEDVEESAGKALGLCVDMIKSLVAENASLTETVKKLGSTGTGRTAVLSIVGKNTTTAPAGGDLTKSQPQAMSGQDFLAKSEVAFNNKALTGRELALVESHINRGEPVPAALIQKVMGAQSTTA